MSCIAVNFSEAKKEIVRVDLKRPVYGKNGEKQEGEFFDSDTEKAVSEITLKRRGLYRVETVMLGTHIQKADIEEHFLEGTTFLIDSSEEIDLCGRYYAKDLCYIKEPGTVLRLTGFTDLEPQTIIEHFHLVIQFCHD